ncbi:MAG TPA: hypothetical protein VHO48_11235, partial [Anaerolineaceae bacterium]|nr:hypothetical protein [Anaerolineaceae bacterium]
EAHRQEYYDLLQRVRTHGDWNSWLLYFLRGVEETSKQAVRQAGALMDLREQLQIETRSKPKAVALIDPLFTNPYLTVSRAAELLNVSLPTARQVVKELEEFGVLHEVTGRAWGKTYVAARILKLIEHSSR